MDIRLITFEDFITLRDSSSSSRPGEGMKTFNPQGAISISNLSDDKGLEFLSQASNLYRLALAAIHLSGGPSPRGTEDAVTRLLNSSTELVRNVQLIHGTMGVASGCDTIYLRVADNVRLNFEQVQKTATIPRQQ
jgi:hypothetical protein